jgi:hypothetical protein
VWLLWRCRRRFLNADRIQDTNPARVLFEAARTRAVTQYPLIAAFVDLQAPNLNKIAETVSKEFAKVVLPVEMMRFTNSEWDELMDSSVIGHYHRRKQRFLTELWKCWIIFRK